MQHSPRHAFSKLGWKARTGAVIGISAGAMTLGAVLPASFASASSFGCNAQAGCATLNSVQPAGINGGLPVSMDARYQQANEKIISYPDHLLDRATSFDKVPHTFRHGALKGDTYYTFVYAPTGDWSNMCVTANSVTGLLNLQVCTHGNSQYQQFIAGRYSSSNGGTIHAPAAIPNFPGHNNEYVLQNVGNTGLGSNASLPNTEQAGLADIHLMEVTYTGNPTNPNPVIPRGASLDGRQMDVNGGVQATTPSAGQPSNGSAVLDVANNAHFTTQTNHHGGVTATATGVEVSPNALFNWRT